MPLLEGHKANFETLQRAAGCGDLALVDCKDAATGEKVAVICAVNFDGEEYQMVPLARMFNGNPYEEVLPP